MKIRVFSDIIGTSIFINNKLAEHDILVKSVWVLLILVKYGIIPHDTDSVSKLIHKYGDFSKIPSIHEFITNDMVNDDKFKFNIDIKSIKINIDKKHPKLFSTLQKYLIKKHNIDFQ